MNFIKTFKESFAHLADEFKSDYEVNEISKMNEEKIDSEYRNMHDIYIQFFRDEKTKLFEIVENIDG
jgi:hypothetical protein